MFEYKIPNKNATRKMYNVKETTEILKPYGVSQNEKKTRDLIGKGKLAASWKGTPNDRHEGYVISEKAIYDFIVSEIPALKFIFKDLEESKITKN